MTPRRRRMLWLLFGLAAVATATALVLNALNQNLMFFYSPSQIQAGQAPRGAAFRLGGLVEVGSFARSADGLEARFVVTDGAHRIAVRYRGLLPDLFKEGKGVVASGRLGEAQHFTATEVLAKHDENYMPPEAAAALEQARPRSGPAGDAR